METEHKLKVGYIFDLRKPEIDKHERAKIIEQLMQKEKLSIRGFAKKYGFNYSTIEDWLLYGKIDKKEYDIMIDNGLNSKQIYKVLRNNRKESKPEILEYKPIDIEIQKLITSIKKVCKSMNISTKTYDLLQELKDTTNRLMLTIDKETKYGK